MRHLIRTLVLLIVAAVPLAAQSPAMLERVRGTAGALNGTSEEFEAYAQHAYTAAALGKTTAQERRALHGRIREAFGEKLEVVDLERAAPTRVMVAVQGSKESGTLVLEHEIAAPHKIVALSIAGDSTAASSAPSSPAGRAVPASPAGGQGRRPGAALPPPPIDGSMEQPQLAAALDRYLQELAGSDRFAGSVLISRNGASLFEKAYGHANRADQIPNTPQTRFNVGSINKQFTRVAVAQLAAAGKLSPDDAIGRHLPDYPNENAKRATIEQLLRHRGGLAGWGGGDDEFARGSKALYRSNRDYYRLVAPKPLLFEPGTTEQYCNACYVVLGEIVERLSGMPYERYIEKNVFAPAGMKTAGFFQTDDPVPNVAVGYTRASGDLRSNVHVRGAGPNAAGGAFARTHDLVVFEAALREGRLLDRKWTAWYFGLDQPVTGRVTKRLTLGGGGPGVSSVAESDGTWTVVAMANLDSPAGSSVAAAIFAALAKG